MPYIEDAVWERFTQTVYENQARMESLEKQMESLQERVIELESYVPQTQFHNALVDMLLREEER